MCLFWRNFLPLTNGMTAVIASDEEILNPLMLGELIVRNKVDIMTHNSYLPVQYDRSAPA